MRVPAGAGPVEVDVVAESLNAMLARLQTSVAATEAALDASRGFAANAAHELRTPLTSIQANLDALHRNPAMPEAERVRRRLRDINAELVRLIALLEALRTLARGEATEGLPTERVDFADLVDAAVQGARRRHPDAVLTFDDPGGRGRGRGLGGGARGARRQRARERGHPREGTRRPTGARPRRGRARRRRGAVRRRRRRARASPHPSASTCSIASAGARARRARASGWAWRSSAQQVQLHHGAIVIGVSPTGGARVDIRLPASNGAARSPPSSCTAAEAPPKGASATRRAGWSRSLDSGSRGWPLMSPIRPPRSGCSELNRPQRLSQPATFHMWVIHRLFSF